MRLFCITDHHVRWTGTLWNPPIGRLYLKKYLIGQPILDFLIIYKINFLFQGLIDIEKEITKLEGKKDKLFSQLSRLREATEIPDYESKVRCSDIDDVCATFFFA